MNRLDEEGLCALEAAAEAGFAAPADVRRLTAEVRSLRTQLKGLESLTNRLAVRVAGQSEILTRNAERPNAEPR